jgi:hypothetical protein
MNNYNKYKFSVLSGVILVLCSFIPVLQILLMLLNGAILKPFDWIFTIKNENILLYGVNGVISILMFVLYFFSHKTLSKFFSLMGILTFFLPLTVYLLTNKIYRAPYFLGFFIVGFLIGVLLFLLDYLRLKILDTKENKTNIKEQP